MNKYCNECNSSPCDGGCRPARYGCDFDINANPYDPSIWNVTINGATTRVKIPKGNETDTKLSTSYSTASLNYNSEKHEDIITGSQLGSLINLESLRDIDVVNADSGDMVIFHPYCSECGGVCTPKDARWEKYHIPDAEESLTTDTDGNYKVLAKTDCGLIEEKFLPSVAPNTTTINYMRDSVPDDPDYPWYYGKYNDTINLYLAQNVSQWFGKYALKITVNYGIQAIVSQNAPNYNFRSIVVPKVDGVAANITREGSILQGFCGRMSDDNMIPWGTQSLRGSLTFIVPKGKEAALYHEYRIRTEASYPNYYSCPEDGQKVPDNEATLDAPLYPASRLNALQIVIEPTTGTSNFNPSVDSIRNQLDAATDLYPNPAG